MKKLYVYSLLLLSSFTAISAENPFTNEVYINPEKYQSDPPISGKMAADTCSACHGTQGRIFNEIFPPLAGIPKSTFIKMMTDFKNGKRPAFIMNSIARTFTQQEIERMAEYFEQQPAKPWYVEPQQNGVKP